MNAMSSILVNTVIIHISLLSLVIGFVQAQLLRLALYLKKLLRM